MLRFCPWSLEPDSQVNNTFVEIFKIKDQAPILLGAITKETVFAVNLAITQVRVQDGDVFVLDRSGLIYRFQNFDPTTNFTFHTFDTGITDLEDFNINEDDYRRRNTLTLIAASTT